MTVRYAGCTLHTGQSSTHNNKYQVSLKHICFCWWWAHGCPKHVEIDKYIKNKLCTNLVLFTRLYRDAPWTKHTILSLFLPWKHKRYGGWAPFILNVFTIWRWVVNFTPRHFSPGREPQYRLDVRSVGPRAIRTFWRGEKSLGPAGIWNPARPTRSFVTTPATISRL